ncbi:MAG: histidine phosphatase family protein [Pseudomonadota bacterium]
MIFLRHPTPDVERGVCYGRLDLGLGPAASMEIAAVLTQLPSVRRLYSSPATRCLKLAEAIVEAHEVDLHCDDRLQELDFGHWEGRRWDEIDRAESDFWTSDPVNRRPPGGESFTEMSGRVLAALAEIDSDSVIITHAGPVRVARIAYLGQSFEEAFATPVPYATPIHLAHEIV